MVFIQFCKAQVSSAVATAADFLTTIAIFMLTAHVMASTATGAVIGGIVNCCMNYRWTFPDTGRKKRSVFWRYLLVWCGSVALNTFGTEYAVRLCQTWFPQDVAAVITCKAIVAVLVAVLWNFAMQKFFVFRKKPLPSSPKGG